MCRLVAHADKLGANDRLSVDSLLDGLRAVHGRAGEREARMKAVRAALGVVILGEEVRAGMGVADARSAMPPLGAAGERSVAYCNHA